MFRAMALKELREIRGVALLGLAAYGVVLWYYFALLLKWRPQTIPFSVEDDFIVGYIWVSALLAVALGVRQTLGESIPETFPFLLHRPATRGWLIGTKMLVGVGAYLLCGLFPILAYGLLAATPGTHASPFHWSMTIPTLVAWLAITVFYLGAFMTGIRPGQWFYSRLFPLAGAAVAALIATAFYIHYGELASLAMVLLIDVWLVAVILFVTRTRDYS